MLQNHVIDPTYFYDAIEQFAFNYDWYVQNGTEIDDLGRRKASFQKLKIRGSLQPQGTNLNQSTSGNTENLKYNFYCKSLYRINVGDFIFYKNRFLHVDGFRDYDEWGVREAYLTMINLNNYHDFKEYLKYLDGEIIVWLNLLLMKILLEKWESV